MSAEHVALWRQLRLPGSFEESNLSPPPPNPMSGSTKYRHLPRLESYHMACHNSSRVRVRDRITNYFKVKSGLRLG